MFRGVGCPSLSLLKRWPHLKMSGHVYRTYRENERGERGEGEGMPGVGEAGGALGDGLEFFRCVPNSSCGVFCLLGGRNRGIRDLPVVSAVDGAALFSCKWALSCVRTGRQECRLLLVVTAVSRVPSNAH